MRRHKIAGLDELSLFFLNDDDEMSTSVFKEILRSTWEREEIPKDWCKSMIVPLYERSDRKSIENHRGISFLSMHSNYSLTIFSADKLVLLKSMCMIIKPVSDPVEVTLTTFALFKKSQNLIRYS